MRGVFAEDDANGSGCAAGGDPVTPTDDESSVIAQGAARKIVLATTGWNQRTEFCKLECAKQGVKCAADPDGDEEPGIRKARGNIAWRADNAHGDRVADGHRNAEADAQDLQKFSFVFAVR